MKALASSGGSHLTSLLTPPPLSVISAVSCRLRPCTSAIVSNSMSVDDNLMSVGWLLPNMSSEHEGRINVMATKSKVTAFALNFFNIKMVLS